MHYKCYLERVWQLAAEINMCHDVETSSQKLVMKSVSFSWLFSGIWMLWSHSSWHTICCLVVCNNRLFSLIFGDQEFFWDDERCSSRMLQACLDTDSNLLSISEENDITFLNEGMKNFVNILVRQIRHMISILHRLSTGFFVYSFVLFCFLRNNNQNIQLWFHGPKFFLLSFPMYFIAPDTALVVSLQLHFTAHLSPAR